MWTAEPIYIANITTFLLIAGGPSLAPEESV
jgi:hypothetical protein